MIELRLLRPDEYGLVADRVRENGGDPIEPDDGLIAAALDDGRVVGFVLLHRMEIINLAMHIDEDYRTTVSWKDLQQLSEMTLELIGESTYYVFPSDERVGKLCGRSRMVKVEAYRKEI